MLRACYLTALCGLQVLLAWQLVPPLAALLDRHLHLGTAGDGWHAAVEVLCAAAAAGGGALSLGFPSLALMRHAQRGAERFTGVPRTAVAVTLAGAALLLWPGALLVLQHGVAYPVDPRIGAAAAPFAPAGIALMSAGTLFGELLRRNRVPRTATALRELQHLERHALATRHMHRPA